ncbi:HAD family phosphatase [Patescibacteria group bacterium]|nr:HAD family phosphatase [Patescibacteria group bacterium]
MNKAFIFDMDGVLIDTEREWTARNGGDIINVFGEKIAQKLGDTIGATVRNEYQKAISMGYSMGYNEYLGRYDKEAAGIFSRAEVTGGVGQLAEKLLKLNFKLGLVSSSPRKWIDFLLPRLSFSDKLEQIVSLNDRTDLKPKPEPDGYLEVLKNLEADPKLSFILEDSNSGIQAAKASGAYVIGFKGNLVDGYVQGGADVYADTMDDVIKLVEAYSG